MGEPRALDDVIREFLVESYENLDRVDSDLLDLERGEFSQETLASIFRGVHTVKGTCGFLGLPRLETVAHRGENLLSLLRDGKLQPRPEIVDALLKTVDAIRQILAHLEETGEEGELDYSDLLLVLEALASGAPLKAAPAPPLIPAIASVATALQPMRAEVIVAPTAAAPAEEIESDGLGAHTLPDETDESNDPTEASEEPAAMTVTKPSSAANEAPAGPDAPPGSTAPSASGEQSSRPSVADSTIRVDVGLLDRVLNLVGELVLARNRILQFAPHIDDASFANASQRLNLLTTELQEGVMKTRMQPIGNVWNKFPRMVRDLCHACHKDVDLELDGTETELDRTIIEAIKDPLTHAVRNALDHGIETPEDRIAAGKPPRGRLLLRAYHEGGKVNIEVTDDGAGLDLARIRTRAIERGLVLADRANNLTDREVAHFIFNPGFSTAAAITNVSGRGVGMDVVKTNIEKIGGSVDISSVRGAGSTLKIKIPLTLAIIPALVVTSHGERFAIPQVNLLELVRLEGEQAVSGIERLYGTPLYRLRGELLPIVFLDEALEIEHQNLEDRPDALNIVVLQADERQFGLVVDTISDTEEIVVKPLGKEIKGLTAFAGATIMGDGQVALILDVLGIAERSSVLSNGKARPRTDSHAASSARSDDQEALLLFTTGPENRMAMPLSMVARLEELAPESVEMTGGHMVVQYRGAILPLIDLTNNLEYGLADRTEPIMVIVYASGGRSVGFVVDTILDAVDEALTVRHPVRRPGTLGAAVIQGKVTDLLDVAGVIDRSDPYLFAKHEAA